MSAVSAPGRGAEPERSATFPGTPPAIRYLDAAALNCLNPGETALAMKPVCDAAGNWTRQPYQVSRDAAGRLSDRPAEAKQ